MNTVDRLFRPWRLGPLDVPNRLVRSATMEGLADGGGAPTLEFAKPGWLPVQRPVDVAWEDITAAPDVVLTRLDPNATAVRLGDRQLDEALGRVRAQPALLDPMTQPKYVNDVPDALDPGFIYEPTDMGGHDYYEVGMYQIDQPLGLIDPLTGEVLRRVPRLPIYPESHYVTPRQVVLDAVETITAGTPSFSSQSQRVALRAFARPYSPCQKFFGTLRNSQGWKRPGYAFSIARKNEPRKHTDSIPRRLCLPKVVAEILESVDRDSILRQARTELKQRLGAAKA